MADISTVNAAVDWYSKERSIFKALAKKVENVVKELVESEKINYYSVTSRAKKIKKYEEKASNPEYTDPISEIFDMAGIRAITYTDSDAKNVHEIVKKSFDLHPVHSIDKSEELGIDKVGYRSLHCVGTLGKDRLRLPENKIFIDRVFEIQIRTILQHAWAEFEHDRNYKFRGVLPKDIARRLSITAGTLELVDREFNEIAKSIDDYISEVEEKTRVGDLNVSIDSKSLLAYVERNLKPLLEPGVETNVSAIVIKILDETGIKTLEEFERIIPKDFVEVYSKNCSPCKSLNALVTTLAVIHSPEKIIEYLKTNEITSGIPQPQLSTIKNYHPKIDEIMKKFDFKTIQPFIHKH